MKRCNHHDGTQCNKPDAVEEFGAHPSLGVCTNVCSWRQVEEAPAVPSLARRAVQLIKAVSSTVTQTIEPAEVAARIELCRKCDHLVPGDPVGHCGACGCGRTRLAELTVKAAMPAAQCPIGKWEKK